MFVANGLYLACTARAHRCGERLTVSRQIWKGKDKDTLCVVGYQAPPPLKWCGLIHGWVQPPPSFCIFSSLHMPRTLQVWGYEGPIYMTHPTKAIMPIMLDDYYKVRISHSVKAGFGDACQKLAVLLYWVRPLVLLLQVLMRA